MDEEVRRIVSRSRKARSPLSSILPGGIPDPGEVREGIDSVLSGLSQAKGIGQELIDHFKSADVGFKELDGVFRSTRIKGLGRDRPGKGRH